MMTLVVLAAGMGSRYGGLKQLDAMGPQGETILDYSVYDAIKAGFTKVVFVIRRSFSEEFQQRAEERYGKRVELQFAYQELGDLPSDFKCPVDREKPWGTAHALWVARELVMTPFAVINADDYYGPNAFTLAAQSLNTMSPTSTDYAVVAYQLTKTLSSHGGVNRGVITQDGEELRGVEEFHNISADRDGKIIGEGRLGERQELAKETLVSMNYLLFTPALFAQLEEFLIRFLAERIEEPKSESYIPAVLDEVIAAQQGRCLVMTTSDQWYGVTYPADKEIVQNALASLHAVGVYPPAL